MGISGFEAMIFCVISPLFLGIPSVKSFALQNYRLLHFLSLSCLAAWLVKDPVARLCTVGFGLSMSCLAWTAAFYGDRANPQRLEARINAFALGLIMSSVAKFAFWTNNPLWPIMHEANGGLNKLGLGLAILAVFRSTRHNLGVGSDQSYLLTGKTNGSPTLAALGIAGLFFAMHSLLSDSSTMILWVWEGWPARGPLAVPHGALTLLAMGGGVLISLFYPTFAKSWTFYGIGSIGAAVLTAYSHWLGYYGALAVAVYVMAVAPALISSAIQHQPGRTFGLAFLIYDVMVLAHVWVVAYAFVPGGPLMREHTDWVMSATFIMIGCGVFSAQASSSTTSTKGKSRIPSPAARKQRSYYLYVLAGLELLAMSIAYLRFPSYNYQPYHPEHKAITAGIWTIHFSLDNDMWSSERRMRDAIQELELDVVGLLESDLQRIIMGNRDTTQFLAEDLNMYVDYGPGPNKHTWGCALLSKFPILNSTHHLLPSPVGELAPAIHATIDAYGQMVDVFVFHSGQDEDPEDRRLQTEYLSNLMGTVTNRPAILLSYLVTKPKEGNYNTYVSELSGMKDIDETDWDRWCEYILYKGLKKTGYARVSRGTITDTEIQVGKFIVGEEDDSQGFVDEGSVPEGLRFPALFRGEGVRGHRYHVFDEPRQVFLIAAITKLGDDTNYNLGISASFPVISALHGLHRGRSVILSDCNIFESIPISIPMRLISVFG